MSKRVILRLIEGSFDQGFPVILRIRDNSTLDETEASGKLPPTPNVLRVLNEWESAYDQRQSTYRIRPKPGQVNNFSCREITELGSQLAECFNEWLNSDSSEWKKIRDELQRSLSETDEIQFIIQTEDMRLRQLPWHLWNLFSNYYTKAEIALSASTHRPPPPSNPTNKVRILAILGDTTDINVEEDKAILEKELPDAEIIFLPQPQLQLLNSELWDQHWDILFFAGHSASQADGSTGQIYINQSDSLSLRDFRNALRTAIRRGLQLAIFNSCDGLGLAQELANLNIRQTIVMRKHVSDKVAQEFLRDFLRIFASGKSLHLAVREARERLQGLEDRFPCASWLPMICQNPATAPLTWSDLLQPKRQDCLPALKKALALGLLLVPIISWAVNDKNWYRLHKDGSIWHGWVKLDNNPKAIAIDANGNELYQLHDSGWIWRYTGTPCNNNGCRGWVTLDNNPKTIAIDANGNGLYQVHNDGSIWQYTGTPCNNNGCRGWVRLGNEQLIGKTDFRWEPAKPKTMTQFNFETRTYALTEN